MISYPHTFIVAQPVAFALYASGLADDVVNEMATEQARNNGATETGAPQIAWVEVTSANLEWAQNVSKTDMRPSDWVALVRVPCRR